MEVLKLVEDAFFGFGSSRVLGYDVPNSFAAPLTIAVLAAVNYAFSLAMKTRGAAKHGAHEFGGPIGAFFMPILLPTICYFLYYACNEHQCISLNPLSPEFFNFKVNPFAGGIKAWLSSIYSTEVLLVYIGWVVLQIVLYYVIPGEIAYGESLGYTPEVRLPYRINAFRCMLISLSGVYGFVKTGLLSPTYGYDNFVQILTATWIVSTALSVYCYVYSRLTVSEEEATAQRVEGKLPPNPLHKLSATGNTGYAVYDFWMGRTLNPRIGFLDLKYVMELRPGLIMWVLLSLSMMYKQMEKLGTNTPTLSMILVNLFHLYYVIDGLWGEKGLLTMMDITTDGFGFMLAFGDLTWVPMTYSLQARYLVDYPTHLSWWVVALIISLKCLGMYIFRASNGQKDTFRRNPEDPSVAHLKTLPTKRGTKLLISGWWGMSRHINYFGDILMGIAWCLPCGFNHIIPYFYAIYFTALLVNRQQRDDDKCKKKYGDDWDKYCEIVPWKIVPYVY